VRLIAGDAPLTPDLAYEMAPRRRGGKREAIVRLTGSSAGAGKTAGVGNTGTAVPAAAASLRLAWSLPASRYAVVVHRQGEGGDLETHWVEPGELGPPLARRGAEPSRTAVAWQYLGLGFTHILPLGLDHILFVLGIFLFATRLKPV